MLVGVLVWFVTLSGLHAVTTPLAVSALIILTLRLDNLRDYLEKLKFKVREVSNQRIQVN